MLPDSMDWTALRVRLGRLVRPGRPALPVLRVQLGRPALPGLLVRLGRPALPALRVRLGRLALTGLRALRVRLGRLALTGLRVRLGRPGLTALPAQLALQELPALRVRLALQVLPALQELSALQELPAQRVLPALQVLPVPPPPLPPLLPSQMQQVLKMSLNASMNFLPTCVPPDFWQPTMRKRLKFCEKECTLTHSGISRGRLRHVSASREYASSRSVCCFIERNFLGNNRKTPETLRFRGISYVWTQCASWKRLYNIYTVHLLACCAYKKYLCLIH